MCCGQGPDQAGNAFPSITVDETTEVMSIRVLERREPTVTVACAWYTLKWTTAGIVGYARGKTVPATRLPPYKYCGRVATALLMGDQIRATAHMTSLSGCRLLLATAVPNSIVCYGDMS